MKKEDIKVSVRRWKKRSNGKPCWRAYYTAEGAKGTKRTASKVLKADDRFRANEEALSYLDEMTETLAIRTEGPLTLSSFLWSYLERGEAAGLWEWRTLHGYGCCIKSVVEVLGDVDVRKITADDLNSYYLYLAEVRGNSPVTICTRHSFLKTAFKEAILRGIIKTNPCDDARPPRRVPKKPGVNYLDAQGRERLLGILAGSDPCPLSIAAYIALYTGMRLSEICSLHWSDVDFGESTIYVRRSATGTNRCQGVKLPKSNKERACAMSKQLAAAIKSWREACLDRGMEITPDSVLIDPDAEELYRPARLGAEWRTFAQTNNLRGAERRIVTLHDLRHTWATMYLAAGGDVMTAKDNLGHAQASMTLNTYATADASARKRAAEVVDVAIAGDHLGPTGEDKSYAHLEEMIKSLSLQNKILMEKLEAFSSTSL